YQYPQMKEEVKQMTEPLIKLPSMIMDELEAEIARQKAEIEDQKAEIAEQNTVIAEKDAEIKRLQELVAQLTANNTSF
ncbi:MAG: hypothetical protein J1F41_08770, partial [Lachnospiraceae bacterium]|nr:hypothetical protein [Lachnospiraceae bacterium]